VGACYRRGSTGGLGLGLHLGDAIELNEELPPGRQRSARGRGRRVRRRDDGRWSSSDCLEVHPLDRFVGRYCLRNPRLVVLSHQVLEILLLGALVLGHLPTLTLSARPVRGGSGACAPRTLPPHRRQERPWRVSMPADIR